MTRPLKIIRLVALLVAGGVACFFVVAARQSTGEVTIRLSMPVDAVMNALADTGAREVNVTILGEPETTNWNYTFMLSDGSVLLVGVDKKSGAVQRLLVCQTPDLKHGLQIGEMAHMDSVILRHPSTGYGK